MAVLLYIYVGYFVVGLSRIYEYVYWELMNFGLRMIGYQPTVHTVVLYVYAGLVLVLGFFSSPSSSFSAPPWLSQTAAATSPPARQPLSSSSSRLRLAQ